MGGSDTGSAGKAGWGGEPADFLSGLGCVIPGDRGPSLDDALGEVGQRAGRIKAKMQNPGLSPITYPSFTPIFHHHLCSPWNKYQLGVSGGPASFASLGSPNPAPPASLPCMSMWPVGFLHRAFAHAVTTIWDALFSYYLTICSRASFIQHQLLVPLPSKATLSPQPMEGAPFILLTSYACQVPPSDFVLGKWECLSLSAHSTCSKYVDE